MGKQHFQFDLCIFDGFILPVRMIGILPKHLFKGPHNNEAMAFTIPNGIVAKPMYFMPMEHAMYD